MTPKQRDIVLIPVPYTDLSSTKRRPVLVLSSDTHNSVSADIVVAAITSNLAASSTGVLIDAGDMETGTLPKQSMVLPGKIYTLSKSIIVKHYGRLKPELLQQVFDALDAVFDR